MASTNYKFLNKISHSKLFNPSRIILTHKQRITTNSRSISISNQHLLQNNYNIYNYHHQYQHKFKFSTSITSAGSDSDDDSDLSDFSDFTDSDSDDDIDDIQTKKSAPPQTSGNPKYNFDRDDVSDDMLMKDRLIISNLNFSTNRNDLWELCENYGTVTDVHLPANRNRDFHNRGFGFVTFESDNDASNAMENIAGIMFNSRQLRVGYARKDTERQATPNQNKPSGDRDRQRQFTDFEYTDTENTSVSMANTGNVGSNTQLKETVITVNGLPGNVNLAQITKMFGDFGNISNITFSPYQMMGHSFMNAIVCVNLKNQGQAGNTGNTSNEALSFQSLPDERDIKDRSVDKDEMRTMRRNNNTSPMAKNQQRQAQHKPGSIDPDILAKEIDELLADTDDEDESSDSSSDSDSNDEGEDGESNEEEDSSSDSDSDDDDDKK